MAGMDGILNTARSALLAQQAAIEVSGHNIANAETEGYSAQRLVLQPKTPQRTPFGMFGTGVEMVNVTRTREALLDTAVRTQTSPASGFERRSALLGSIESVPGDPSDTGPSAHMDSFWNAWTAPAPHPTPPAAKSVVQQRGDTLARTFNRYATQLGDIAASARQEAADTVSEVNRLVSQVAEINKQIVPLESNGKTANDLRDQRDLLIDQLSSLVPINVVDNGDGSDQITIGGLSLVDSAAAKSLTITSGSPLSVRITGNSDPLRNISGKLGAVIDVVNNDLATVTRALDSLASALITDINAAHTTGWSPPAGATGNWNAAAPPTGSGVAFFDAAPSSANAKNIRLSAAVAANPNSIVTGTMLNAAGDNSVALAMAALRDRSPSAIGNSFGGAYRSLVSSLAGSKRSSDDSATVSKTLVSQASTRRKSSSGVSTDEELVQLMKHQQAYAAAAKVIQTVSELSQILIDLKR